MDVIIRYILFYKAAGANWKQTRIYKKWLWDKKNCFDSLDVLYLTSIINLMAKQNFNSRHISK